MPLRPRSDEYVLSLYPSAIRRRVLRHLYLGPLKQCYLFNNMQPKFLVRTLCQQLLTTTPRV